MKSSLVVIMALLLLSCSETEVVEAEARALPILGHRDLSYSTVDGKEVVDTVYHVIPPFSYLNQDSIMMASKSIQGKVWIADFFFSHCPSICPSMTSNMKTLNENLADLVNEIEFLSFSIDPDRDQPSRLREYIEEYNITASNWQFLTGNEEATHRLGVDDFLVNAMKDDAAPGGFAHSPGFTLVDKAGRVRGVYIGTNLEEVNKLEQDVRKLLEVEYGIKESK